MVAETENGANKIRSCNINELKEKLVRFYFHIGGCRGGRDTIDIVKSNGKIDVDEYSRKGKDKKYNFPKIKWNEFIDKIFDIEIHKWKNTYYNDMDDGCQWELKMEFSDLPEFEVYGSNKYPKNWNKLRKLLKNFFLK